MRYLKIRETCAVTGLSQYYLRNGIKAGIIPHIRCGTTYYIDVDALAEYLRRQTRIKEA